MRGVVLNPKKYWECASCGLRKITTDPRPTTELHACPRHNGVAIPFTQVHPEQASVVGKLHHRVDLRGDYEAGERGLRRDAAGRPIMAVRTERPDGSYDTHVFAGLATMDAHGMKGPA